MAERRIGVVVDIESKDVKFATDRVLSLQQQIRLLTKEIQNVDPSSESFRVLSKKLNDTQDQLKTVRARSGELFNTFSLLPGPIGEISSKLDGSLSLLKTFSQFKLSDLTNQFKGLGRDLKDAFLSLGDWDSATQKSAESSSELAKSNEDLGESFSTAQSAVASQGAEIQRNVATLKSQDEATKENINVLSQKVEAEKTLQNNLKASITQQEANLLTLKKGTPEYKEQTKAVESLKNEYINSTNYQKRYQTELSVLTTTQQKNTVSATADAVAQGEVAVASQAATVATRVQTVTTNALTVAQNAAATAGRVLRAVLASLGIGLIIVAITTLATKIYEWVSSTKEADLANQNLGKTLDNLNRKLENNLSLVDEQVQIATLRAQMAGKSEKEINDITINGINKRIEAYKKGRKDLENELAKLPTLGLSEEDLKKRQEEISTSYAKLGDNIIDLESQRRVQIVKGEKALSDAKKEQRDKDKSDAKEAADKELERRKNELDALIELEIRKANTDKKTLEDLLAKRLELEKLAGAQLQLAQQENRDKVTTALKDDVDKQQEIRLKSINAIIEAEESASEVDVERLKKLLLHKRDLELQNAELLGEERRAIAAKYDKLIRDIDNKAREEKLVEDIAANQGNFDAQIELYRKYQQQVLDSETYNSTEQLRIVQDTNEKIKQLNQQRFEAQLISAQNEAGVKFQYDADYYDKVRQLYDAEKIRYKALLDSKQISQAEYDRFIADSTKTRIDLDKEELNAKMANFQAVSQLFAAGSALVGEQTKAGKAFAVAGATIDTYVAANQVLRDPTLPTFLKAISAAAIIIRGLANVRRIVQTPIPGQTAGGSASQTPPGSTPVGPIQVQAGGRAQGGFVQGEGTGTSDSIPAMLSNGEYVINARSTKMFGGLLNLINSAGRQPKMSFALGGPVSPMNAPVTQEGLGVLGALDERPIKTYVVASEVTSQQQFERTIKSRSLI